MGYIVPKFEQIYLDALGPDHPLPAIILFIIGAHIPLALIAMAWPVSVMIGFWRRFRGMTWLIYSGYVFFVVIIGISIIALFMPMIVDITGISDGPISSSAAGR